jgi:outer membrane protein TolC
MRSDVREPGDLRKEEPSGGHRRTGRRAGWPAGGRLLGSSAVRRFGAIAVALSVLFLPPPGPKAAEPAVQVLSLPEALRLASERNRDIRQAVELRNQLEGRYLEERAAAFPQVTITGNTVRQRDESQEVLLGRSFPPTTVTTFDAAVSQPLFTWGQVGAAIRAAKVGLATADDQLRLARQGALREVTQAFYDVLLAKELRAVSEQGLGQRLRHLDEAKKRHSAGVATEYDVLAGEVAVANARPDVIRAENLVRFSRDRLRFLLAIEEGEVDADGTLEVEESTYPGYEEALERAKRNRPELQELRHRLAVTRELVTIARAGDKPRLDARGNWGWRHLDAGSAEGSGQEWSAGLFATWPLFDGFRTRGRVAQARSGLASLQIEERKLLDSIALGVRDAENEVRQAAETMRALSGTVTQAERLLYMAEKGFEHGVKARLEVEDAEFNLRQARSNLVRAKRDYLVARATLDWMMGGLGE